MASKLSFSIAINLLTENFKRGTSSVKAGFRAMQMQVLTFAAALGAGGLGLSNFVSRLIDVTRETGRVTTALKNVSGSAVQFADSQRFLLDMAKKYGLEINALTGNFAKFTAASSASGMAMDQQKKIFESVSRACTAFGMSADDSNGVFLALSQMMSKGKISSEELRLQMGERLPIALQAMAKAAGVSVGELDKLMKQGKLMSKDVLPGFADALNEMIPNVDTDNLETSINKLQNAFTEFTKGTNIQSAYKGLIDWLTGAVKGAGENIKGIINSVVAFIIGVSLGKLFKWIVVELAKSQRAAMVAASKAAKAAGIAFDEVAWKAKSTSITISTAFSRMGKAIKAAFISALPTAILTVLSLIIAKIVTARQESNRIKSIFSDYKKEASNVTNTAEVSQLERLKLLANDVNAAFEERKGAVLQLNKLLGTSFSIDEKTLKINGDINGKIAERIKLLEATAKVDFYTQKKIEAQDSLRKQYDQYGGEKQFNKEYLSKSKEYEESIFWVGAPPKVFSDMRQAEQLEKIIADSTREINDATKYVSANETKIDNSVDDPDNDKTKKTDLQKAEENYAEKLKELANQKASNAIKEKEYNKAVDDLNQATYKQIAGILSPEKAAKNETFQKAKTGVEKPLSPKETPFSKEYANYEKEYAKIVNSLENRVITEDKYNEDMLDLIDSTLQNVGVLDDIGEEGKNFIEALKKGRSDLKEAFILPKEEKRDTTFDYKKTKVEKIEGEKSYKEKHVDKLKSGAGKDADKLTEDIKAGYLSLDQLKAKYNTLAPELVESLNSAMQNVTTLEDALKIARVQQDVKDLSKELNSGIYSGVKDIASSADRLVSSWGNLSDIMSDVDATGWERIMAVWSALTNTVDSFLSIIQMIEKLTAITDKLAAAKEAEAVIDTAVTGVKVVNAGTEVAAEATALGIQTGAEVAASALKTTAATTEMAAKSTAAYAGIPFAGVGLATTQIAAMQALIAAAAIPKFANGGIVVGGPSSGDKILARVNAGEMILNHGQQSKLFNAIDSGKLGSSSSVNIGFDRVRGSDIYLSLKNYLKSTGKKL